MLWNSFDLSHFRASEENWQDWEIAKDEITKRNLEAKQVARDTGTNMTDLGFVAEAMDATAAATAAGNGSAQQGHARTGQATESVLRVALTLNNTGSSQLIPTTNSPSSLFRRCRLLCGGTEIYDLLDYGRVHPQMTFQLPAARLMEDATEGWGATDTASSPSTLSHAFTPAPIASGAGRRMMCQLICLLYTSPSPRDS